MDKQQTKKESAEKLSAVSASDARKLVATENNGKWGFLDAATGEEVVPFKYDYAHSFSVFYQNGISCRMYKW